MQRGKRILSLPLGYQMSHRRSTLKVDHLTAPARSDQENESQATPGHARRDAKGDPTRSDQENESQDVLIARNCLETFRALRPEAGSPSMAYEARVKTSRRTVPGIVQRPAVLGRHRHVHVMARRLGP